MTIDIKSASLKLLNERKEKYMDNLKYHGDTLLLTNTSFIEFFETLLSTYGEYELESEIQEIITVPPLTQK